MSEKIIYEPHPVTPERKAELRAKGYQIIDAQFAPKSYKYPAAEKPQAKAPEKAPEKAPDIEPKE